MAEIITFSARALHTPCLPLSAKQNTALTLLGAKPSALRLTPEGSLFVGYVLSLCTNSQGCTMTSEQSQLSAKEFQKQNHQHFPTSSLVIKYVFT